MIAKSEHEYCLIEASVNSVRFSITIRKQLDLEQHLTRMLERFMSLRADKFHILRRKPISPEYDFSFLISDEHLTLFKKEELINFLLEFVQAIGREIADMLLLVNNFTRCAATYYVHGVAGAKVDWNICLIFIFKVVYNTYLFCNYLNGETITNTNIRIMTTILDFKEHY